MFDSIITQSQAPRGNRAGLALALLISGAMGALSLVLFRRASVESPADVDVTLISARAAPPPPPPPPAGASASRRVERKTITRRRELVLQPKVEPEPAHDETPAQPPADPGGEAGGVVGGVVGGTVGGIVGGTIGGVPGGVVGGGVGGAGNSVLPFGAGMTRPQQISGGTPQYSREALAARVEGKVMIRCTITVQGEVIDCKVLRSVPMLDELALATLRQSRYTPVTLQGHPESVQYLFTFNFKLP